MSENVGHVIQVAGPTVDVQFVEGTMPPIYQALRVVSDGFTVPSPINVILEGSSISAKAACAASPWRRPTAWFVA